MTGIRVGAPLTRFGARGLFAVDLAETGAGVAIGFASHRLGQAAGLGEGSAAMAAVDIVGGSVNLGAAKATLPSSINLRASTHSPASSWAVSR